MSSTFRPSAPSKHTVVEEGSSFKGTLTSTCPIHVHGRIEGDLETPALTVSPTGAVHGRVKVGSVRSQGELSGEFDADSVELAGTVRDNTVIRARSLEVKLASTRGKLQVIFGECELAVGDEPTEHDAVDAVPAKPELAAADLPMLVTENMARLQEPPAVTPTFESLGTAIESATAVEPPAPEPVADELASLDAHEDELEDAPDAEALGAQQAGGNGKRGRKRRQDGEMPKTGWSQPPSQPPPAN